MPEASASRGHRHRHRDQERVSRIPTLPEYQPLTAPLNPAGQRALAALVQGGSFRRLHAHLQHAAEKLTETAGEAIERATDARVRYERQRKRRAENKEDGDDADQDEDKNEDEDNSNDEESKKLIQLEERVQDVTENLEEKMRRVIDAEVKLAALEKTIGLLSREANDAGNASQGREANNVNEEEGDSSDEAKQEPAKAIQPLTDKLAAKLAQDRAEWEALSLTKRYSANNTYVGFYRMVHDAKHPGDDIPPLPHASTWFSHLEAPAPKEADESSSRRPKQRNCSASPADSDDIAIAGERRSLKCPLTLLPFKDPVTSTKCPHSFERQAIEDMIQKSTDSVAVKGGGPPQRMRCARCPVCSVKLTMNDLRRDPNLLRRVRRAQAAQTQQEEDEELNNSRRQKQLKRGRMGGFTVADDDDDEDTAEDEVEIGDDDDQDETKAEEIEIDENGSPTVIPNTQYSVEEDHMEE